MRFAVELIQLSCRIDAIYRRGNKMIRVFRDHRWIVQLKNGNSAFPVALRIRLSLAMLSTVRIMPRIKMTCELLADNYHPDSYR